MVSNTIHIRFTEFPDIKESVKAHTPYYWYNLSLHKAYIVVSDYEKVVDGKSVHFFLIVNDEKKFSEVPVMDNITCNFVG